LSLGIRYRPILALRHPAIKKLLRLGVPLFLYLVVANAAAVLERSMASRISAGAVSTLTYAFRLFTVPANFLAAPLAIVAYPGFAREAARDQRGELAGQTSRLFQLVIFLFLPVTVWTILNANIITRVLYEHGRFSESSSWITAHLLAIYSIGIMPNAIAIVLLRCFYAIEDTVTPLLTELTALVYFVITAPYLTHRFGIGGLVAARTVAFFLVTGTLLIVLRWRYALLKFDFETLRFFLRVLAATCVMALLSWTALHLLQPAFNSGNMAMRLAVVGMVLLLGGSAFLTTAHFLGLSEAKQIMNAGRGWFARQQS
jgi:putative peptidoglycan lipid II flippase